MDLSINLFTAILAALLASFFTHILTEYRENKRKDIENESFLEVMLFEIEASIDFLDKIKERQITEKTTQENRTIRNYIILNSTDVVELHQYYESIFKIHTPVKIESFTKKLIGKDIKKIIKTFIEIHRIGGHLEIFNKSNNINDLFKINAKTIEECLTHMKISKEIINKALE